MSQFLISFHFQSIQLMQDNEDEDMNSMDVYQPQVHPFTLRNTAEVLSYMTTYGNSYLLGFQFHIRKILKTWKLLIVFTCPNLPYLIV